MSNSKKTKRTIVYIDGFNLYYGSLKGTSFKWLNPEKLVLNILSETNKIESIKYFTARVSARREDPSITNRQNIYFRALQTINNLKIILGHYLTYETHMKLVSPPLIKEVKNPITNQVSHREELTFVDVLKTEEKGSDVNIASHLLMDGFKNKFDVAVIISNDSDLATPVKMVKREFKKHVVIINPHDKLKESKVLNQFASKTFQITPSLLSNSLFPNELKDNVGNFKKPQDW